MMKVQTLQESIIEYRDDLVRLGKSRVTVNDYVQDLKRAIDFFNPETPMTQIRLDRVGAYFKWHRINGTEENPLHPVTVGRTKRTFRRFMEWALENGKIEILPIPKASRKYAKK